MARPSEGEAGTNSVVHLVDCLPALSVDLDGMQSHSSGVAGHDNPLSQSRVVPRELARAYYAAAAGETVSTITHAARALLMAVPGSSTLPSHPSAPRRHRMRLHRSPTVSTLPNTPGRICCWV
ncbi:hypothetical protein AAHC03_020555 [Spirometra sp. Aus1]